ncbi:MAG TPA: succinate dehydrogenase assembly factor 2 [Rhizomicrobium sp.]|jgi:antitoxin CptB|nr:succinate dehydrogenase assembly factor 2 [Rhizomicrobium sp.]
MTTTDPSGALEARRKRLLFRARRRGFREVDLIFGTFADEALAHMSDAELDAFEALLTVPDQEVYAWLQGAEIAPTHDTPVFARMKALCARVNPTWNA